jgi:hypothetical protein
MADMVAGKRDRDVRDDAEGAKRHAAGAEDGILPAAGAVRV